MTIIEKWVAKDVKTGEAIAPPRFSEHVAQKDCDQARRKGVEAVPMKIEVLTG
jgi:hypothetical protein